MAGQLTIDTLKAGSGVLATQNGMTGIAKAWVNFNGSTAAINGSFNVGSITKNSTGNYTVNFTTAMTNANYSISTTGWANLGVLARFAQPAGTPTTSSFIVVTDGVTGVADLTYVYATVFGA